MLVFPSRKLNALENIFTNKCKESGDILNSHVDNPFLSFLLSRPFSVFSFSIISFFLDMFCLNSPCFQCPQRGSPPVLGQDQDRRHCVVGQSPPSPPFSAVTCCPLPPPAVLRRYLPSPTRNCLTSWGTSLFIMTASCEFTDEDGLQVTRM